MWDNELDRSEKYNELECLVNSGNFGAGNSGEMRSGAP